MPTDIPNRYLTHDETLLPLFYLDLLLKMLITSNTWSRRHSSSVLPNTVLTADHKISDIVELNSRVSTSRSSSVTCSSSCPSRSSSGTCSSVYHIEKVWVLQPADYPLREKFCEWKWKSRNVPFPFVILATNEVFFTLNRFTLSSATFWSNDAAYIASYRLRQ